MANRKLYKEDIYTIEISSVNPSFSKDNEPIWSIIRGGKQEYVSATIFEFVHPIDFYTFPEILEWLKGTENIISIKGKFKV